MDAEPEPDIVVALYDFEPQREGQLGFSAGDEIKVKSVNKSGWWSGEACGDEGIFPANYTKVVSYKKKFKVKQQGVKPFIKRLGIQCGFRKDRIEDVEREAVLLEAKEKSREENKEHISEDIRELQKKVGNITIALQPGNATFSIEEIKKRKEEEERKRQEAKREKERLDALKREEEERKKKKEQEEERKRSLLSKGALVDCARSLKYTSRGE